MTPVQILDSEYSINESDPNFTAASATAAGSGDGVTEALLGTFQCPRGLQVVCVAKVSTFAAYLKDNEAAPAELADGTPVRIVYKDAAGYLTLDRMKTVYAGVKEFADKMKMKFFGDKWKLIDTEKLLIYVVPASGVSLNPAASRFEICCRKIGQIRT